MIRLSVFAFILIAISGGYCYAQSSGICSEKLRIGQELHSQGRWSEAIGVYKELIEFALNENSSSCASKAYSNLANVYAAAGEFFQKSNKDSLKTGLQLPAQFDLFDQAENCYAESLKYAWNASDSLRIAYASYGLAIVSYQKKEYSEAIKKYSKVEEWISEVLFLTKDQKKSEALLQLRSWNLNLRGLSLLELGRNTSDKQLFLRSLRDFRRTITNIEKYGHETELIEVSHNIALAFEDLGEPDSSLFYNRKSLALNEEFAEDNLYNKSKSWYGLSSNFEQLEQLDSALYYLRKYNNSHGDLINEEQSASIAQWLVLFETEKKDLEIKNLKFIQLSGGITFVLLIIILIIIVQKRLVQNRLANQKINDLLQQQEINSLQGVLAGQEKERQRIATDLHDKLGAILGMVKLHFSAVEERIDVLRDDNKKQYDKANELLDKASTEVRNISHNLLSGVLVKFGLVPALQDLKDTVEATGKLKVQLVAGDQTGGRLSGEQELQVYRIVQELISNILKHAKATEAVIQLNRTNGEINLIVEDNGVGFDVEAARQKQGIGLKNLEARAAKLKAKLHFDSGKGAGTTVSVDIPLNSGDL